jgi:capsular polysaccharide biosynthesis protein
MGVLQKISFEIENHLRKKMIRIYRRDSNFEWLRPVMKKITRNWFYTIKPISATDYKLNYPNRIHFLSESVNSLFYAPICFFGDVNKQTLYSKNGLKQYVALFYNIKIVAGSGMLILDEQLALNDLFFLNKNSNIDYTDEAIVAFQKNNSYIIERYTKTKLIAKGILMTGNYDLNFYHFLYEVIVKFKVLSEAHIDNDVPLIFNKNCTNVPQLMELIKIFNFDNREIVVIDKQEIATVEQLYHCSCPNNILPNYKNIIYAHESDNLFDIDSLNYVKEKCLAIKKTKYAFEKVFLSRKKEGKRRKYNEAEIASFLQTKGFTIIYPEELTFAEQVGIFNSAKCIVGATGAAFSNTLFCSKGCKIICLTNFKIQISIFSTLATLVEADLVYLFDRNLPLNEHSDIHADFRIDIQELSNALN